MTSDEIREQYDDWMVNVRKALASKDVEKAKAAMLSEPILKISFLAEIALQLALLNEHFRKADESVFGVKDRT
jgi:hypothetical protein